MEVERFEKFQRVLLGIKGKIEIGNIDIQNYAKYMLREETTNERRELLGCLRGNIIFKNKAISIA